MFSQRMQNVNLHQTDEVRVCKLFGFCGQYSARTDKKKNSKSTEYRAVTIPAANEREQRPTCEQKQMTN